MKRKGCNHTHKGEECDVHGKKECPAIEEAVRIPAKTGNLVNVIFRFRSSTIMLKMFFPQVSYQRDLMLKIKLAEFILARNYYHLQFRTMNQENQFFTQKEQHGQKSQERIKRAVLTRKAEDLTKEKIQEATLRHQARRLEIPVANPSVLE